MNRETLTKQEFLSLFAGLGVGIAGASLVIAVQWYCEVMLCDYAEVWASSSTWVLEFLAIVAASVVLSGICFRKLHKADVWRCDCTDHMKRRMRKILICLLIFGICCGVVLRICGGAALLWYNIKVMESKGVMWLGGYIFTVKRLIAIAISSLIGAICMLMTANEYKDS